MTKNKLFNYIFSSFSSQVFSIGKKKLLQNFVFTLSYLDIIASRSMRAYINVSYKGYQKRV